MSIYEYSNYRRFLKQWMSSQPKKGRGLASKMAAHLRVSSTMMSQVLNGDRHLNLELASELGDFMALNPEEQEYFFLLIDYERAGTPGLKNKLKKKLQSEQTKAAKLEERLKVDRQLSEQANNLFYSNWLYTGIRNLAAIAEFNDIDAIAERLQLPRIQVQKVVAFLLQHELLILEKGQLISGPQKTHLRADSILVSKHHQNWRLQGFQQMHFQSEQNFFYTGPMSLSKELAEEIRREIPGFLEQIYKRLGPSPSETVRCLNIDWFEY